MGQQINENLQEFTDSNRALNCSIPIFNVAVARS